MKTHDDEELVAPPSQPCPNPDCGQRFSAPMPESYNFCHQCGTPLKPGRVSVPTFPVAVDRPAARMFEIVGPDGKVHYRRPEGDPLLDEARDEIRRRIGYTVRPMA